MSRRRIGTSRRRGSGFAMLEVLVALVVATFGVLSLAVLQNRSIALEVEANQRAQALVLLQDMAERLSANRQNAGAYVANDIGVGAMAACDPAGPRSAFDLCEWGNLLRGAAAMAGARGTGAMIGARGCITQPAPANYLIVVAWQGMMETAAPTVACGQGAYGAAESARRAVTTVARFADLQGL